MQTGSFISPSLQGGGLDAQRWDRMDGVRGPWGLQARVAAVLGPGFKGGSRGQERAG